MNKEIERLTDVKIMFEYYYKHKNLEKYSILIDSSKIYVDYECLDILENPKTMLYITPFKKYKKLKEENQKIKKSRDFYLRFNKSLMNRVDEYRKENQKLNKIIDELENYLKEGCDLPCGCGISIDYKYAYENVLDKLTELKKEVE